ncbi:MAG: phosphohistidine phosphatase [Bacteroidota bacterium]|jgi:phosphohistidine phosphatase
MRHAKSSWDSPLLDDHSRGLNSRGKNDAPLMAEQIKQKGILPEIVYSSDSIRTKETLKLVTSVLPIAKTQFISKLYLASESEIYDVIKQIDNQFDTALIIAHNPGITEAFYYLANVHIDNVPTSGVGCLTFDVNHFSEIRPRTGRLEYFIYPNQF